MRREIANNQEGLLLLTAGEAAATLRLSRSGFLARVKRGEAPRPLRLGRRTVWPREALEGWIRATYMEQGRRSGDETFDRV